jgi:4'-phosphopantetheinyl transferase
MIQIYYAYTDILQNTNLDCFIAQLSFKTKSKYFALKRKEDKDLLIISSILLSKLLDENVQNDLKLSDLQYSNTGRPFFADSRFDFNISHTDNCAAVAYSQNCRIGIDIEKINDVNFSDFENIFSEKEWNLIYSSDNKNETFYNYWTLLESALKADGRGLSLISSNKIAICNDQVFIDGTVWFSKRILFDSSISCCISSNRKIEDINIHKIEII